MQIIKKMESQNGGAAPSRRDTKRERANYSATNGKARRKRSRPPVQAAWTRYTPGQTNEDANAYIHELHGRLLDALDQWRCADDYIEELQIKLDEAQRHADWVHEDCVHGESQRLADAQEQIQELEEDLASTVEKLHGETTQVDCLRWFLLQKASEVKKKRGAN